MRSRVQCPSPAPPAAGWATGSGEALGGKNASQIIAPCEAGCNAHHHVPPPRGCVLNPGRTGNMYSIYYISSVVQMAATTREQENKRMKMRAKMCTIRMHRDTRNCALEWPFMAARLQQTRSVVRVCVGTGMWTICPLSPFRPLRCALSIYCSIHRHITDDR